MARRKVCCGIFAADFTEIGQKGLIVENVVYLLFSYLYIISLFPPTRAETTIYSEVKFFPDGRIL